MKDSEKYQKAAYAAHQRGQQALNEGDIEGAFVNDDESDTMALTAMLLRLQGE